MGVALRQDRIIDKWQTLIDYGAGSGQRILESLEEALREGEPPGLEWEEDDVTPSAEAAVFGKVRRYLVFHHPDLKDYQMFVGAQDFGQHLNCSWFVTIEAGLAKRILSKMRTGNPKAYSLSMDAFDELDLKAHVTIVHRSFIKVIRELMEELKQDSTGMNTQSEGYLSVW